MDIIPGEKSGAERPAGTWSPAPGLNAVTPQDPLSPPPAPDPLLSNPSALYDRPAPPRAGAAIAKIAAGALIAVIVLGGGLFHVIREATASPVDVAACRATMEALENDMQTGEEMMTRLAAAESDQLRKHGQRIARAADEDDVDRIVDEMNAVIRFCRGISRQFRRDFEAFCDRRADMCEKR